MWGTKNVDMVVFIVIEIHICAKMTRSHSCVSFSLPSLRMLRTTGHGGRHNIQPTDNSLLHPPCSFWLAEVVPVLFTPQQEGLGQRLDCCRKWQMAVDPGKARSQDRTHTETGRTQTNEHIQLIIVTLYFLVGSGFNLLDVSVLRYSMTCL